MHKLRMKILWRNLLFAALLLASEGLAAFAGGPGPNPLSWPCCPTNCFAAFLPPGGRSARALHLQNPDADPCQPLLTTTSAHQQDTRTRPGHTAGHSTRAPDARTPVEHQPLSTVYEVETPHSSQFSTPVDHHFRSPQPVQPVFPLGEGGSPRAPPPSPGASSEEASPPTPEDADSPVGRLPTTCCEGGLRLQREEPATWVIAPEDHDIDATGATSAPSSGLAAEAGGATSSSRPLQEKEHKPKDSWLEMDQSLLEPWELEEDDIEDSRPAARRTSDTEDALLLEVVGLGPTEHHGALLDIVGPTEHWDTGDALLEVVGPTAQEAIRSDGDRSDPAESFGEEDELTDEDMPQLELVAVNNDGSPSALKNRAKNCRDLSPSSSTAGEGEKLGPVENVELQQGLSQLLIGQRTVVCSDENAGSPSSSWSDDASSSDDSPAQNPFLRVWNRGALQAALEQPPSSVKDPSAKEGEEVPPPPSVKDPSAVPTAVSTGVEVVMRETVSRNDAVDAAPVDAAPVDATTDATSTQERPTEDYMSPGHVATRGTHAHARTRSHASSEGTTPTAATAAGPTTPGTSGEPVSNNLSALAEDIGRSAGGTPTPHTPQEPPRGGPPRPNSMPADHPILRNLRHRPQAGPVVLHNVAARKMRMQKAFQPRAGTAGASASQPVAGYQTLQQQVVSTSLGLSPPITTGVYYGYQHQGGGGYAVTGDAPAEVTLLPPRPPAPAAESHPLLSRVHAVLHPSSHNLVRRATNWGSLSLEPQTFLGGPRSTITTMSPAIGAGTIALSGGPSSAPSTLQLPSSEEVVARL